MKHGLVGFLSVLGLLVIGCSAQLGVAQPEQTPPPPVVYENLAFPDLPFNSKFVEVHGAQMHYYEAGDPNGEVIVLTHGVPSWSYIWRDIIPHLENHGRVIAFDLIGFGMSDKLADNDYSFEVQRRYFKGFMDALDLDNITLVLHDWGSGIGFDYAATNPDKIRALVFFEAMMPPRLPFNSIEDGFPGNPQGAEIFQAWRTPGVGEEIILNQNIFLEAFLPSFMLRELTPEEINAYRAPWPTPESRWPLWWVPNELPIAGTPANTDLSIRNYILWLQSTDIPMLEFYATPGLTGQAEVVAWTRQNINNLSTINLGEGIHFLQEDYPTEIGIGIAAWFQALP
ncbi:MAG: haloalkane dehalogenase [Deinococcota bacterium]